MRLNLRQSKLSEAVSMGIVWMFEHPEAYAQTRAPFAAQFTDEALTRCTAAQAAAVASVARMHSVINLPRGAGKTVTGRIPRAPEPQELPHDPRARAKAAYITEAEIEERFANLSKPMRIVLIKMGYGARKWKYTGAERTTLKALVARGLVQHVENGDEYMLTRKAF